MKNQRQGLDRYNVLCGNWRSLGSLTTTLLIISNSSVEPRWAKICLENKSKRIINHSMSFWQVQQQTNHENYHEELNTKTRQIQHVAWKLEIPGKLNQSRTNGPINAHLTIDQVMPRYKYNNEKQEA